MAKPEFLHDAVAFDEPVENTLPGGVTLPGWAERYACRAQFIYARGGEVVEAARREGRSVFKVRIRSCTASRAIRVNWRMRDTRRSEDYNIIEADAVTDGEWVYLVVQSGKAP